MAGMKKALIATTLLATVTAVLWAAPGDKGPVVPPEPQPEEQARELLAPQAQRNNFPRQVRVQVELIEMPHELLTELLYKGTPSNADAGMLRDVVQARVKKGDATILETMICTARSGEKALSESISEYIYPTAYERAQVPNSVSISVNGVTATAEDGKTTSPLELAKLIAPPTPTSFETRNCGSTLEIEPTLGGDDKTIDLRFAPDCVWHTGDTYYMEEKDSLGNVTKIQMPLIYSVRTTTALTLKDGQYQMPCVLTPKDVKGNGDPSRKVMLFVKCDVLVVR
jgi:hypothetical protein